MNRCLNSAAVLYKRSVFLKNNNYSGLKTMQITKHSEVQKHFQFCVICFVREYRKSSIKPPHSNKPPPPSNKPHLKNHFCK